MRGGLRRRWGVGGGPLGWWETLMEPEPLLLTFHHCHFICAPHLRRYTVYPCVGPARGPGPFSPVPEAGGGAAQPLPPLPPQGAHARCTLVASHPQFAVQRHVRRQELAEPRGRVELFPGARHLRQRGAQSEGGGGAGMHWKGGRYPPPSRAPSLCPANCPSDGKCQAQWHW